MNFKHFIYGAAALALAASCANDTDLDGSNGFEQLGDGYIAVKINLPSDPASAYTRAANDQYDDGKLSEYNVTNAALLLFTGDSEDKAAFVAAYDLRDMSKHDDTDDGATPDDITTTYLKTVRVDNIEKLNQTNLYGLVLVNYNRIGFVDETDNHSFTLLGKKVESFSDFVTATNANLEEFIGAGKDNFFMANAVLSSKDGKDVPTGADITTLVKLNENVYKTETEAASKPAGVFFVERAVAKATLQYNLTNDSKIEPEGSYDVNNTGLAEGETAISANDFFAIKDVTWMLGNCEPNSYVVRNVGQAKTADMPFFPWTAYRNAKYSGGNPYRFLGTLPMGTNGTIQPTVENAFRTYWCYDPHYKSDLPNQEDSKHLAFGKIGLDYPLYCHENTFNVDQQNHRNTTFAYIKVTLKENKTFYTINGNDNEIYASQAAATSYAVKYIVESTAVLNALQAVAPAGQAGDVIAGAQKYVDITFARDTDGYLKVKSIKFNNNDGVLTGLPTFKDGEEKTLRENANAKYQIAMYVNGESYYDVRFEHFAGADTNDLAPWFDFLSNTPSTAESYRGSEKEQNFLGRYGMVRNNWYDLSITKIQHLGRPAPVDIQVELPDDEKKDQEWISFRVNILSWAKRTQNTIL